MAYRIMKSLISNSIKTNEELATMADVYYGSGRLTEEQYTEIATLIGKRKEINELTVSVKEMAVNMANMLEEQKKQGERLGALEGKDGKMWQKVTEHVVTAIVGAVICYMLMHVGL